MLCGRALSGQSHQRKWRQAQVSDLPERNEDLANNWQDRGYVGQAYLGFGFCQTVPWQPIPV
jgi:hypothetical protein